MTHKLAPMTAGEMRVGVAFYAPWRDLLPVCQPNCRCVRHQSPDDPWMPTALTMRLPKVVRRG